MGKSTAASNALTENEKPFAIPLPWQVTQWQQLLDAQLQDRLPHALLMLGEAGLGKSDFAHALAKRLLCQSSDGCGACKSCRLFEAGTHVDLLVISLTAESKQIKIDQIRALSEFVFARPQISQRRAVIIEPADALNIAAANALLKCLEEPGDNSHLILVTDKPSSILPTVRSRCQQLSFRSPEPNQAIRWLQEQPEMAGKDENAINNYLAAAQRAPLQALVLTKDGLYEKHHEMQNTFYQLAIGRDQPSPIAIAAEWGSEPVERLVDWLFAWTQMLLGQLMQRNSDLIRASAVESLLHYLQEVLEEVKASAQDEWLANCSRNIYSAYQRLIDIRRAILSGANMNQQLLMEEFLLKWQGVLATRVCRQ